MRIQGPGFVALVVVVVFVLSPLEPFAYYDPWPIPFTFFLRLDGTMIYQYSALDTVVSLILHSSEWTHNLHMKLLLFCFPCKCLKKYGSLLIGAIDAL